MDIVLELSKLLTKEGDPIKARDEFERLWKDMNLPGDRDEFSEQVRAAIRSVSSPSQKELGIDGAVNLSLAIGVYLGKHANVGQAKEEVTK